MSHSEPGNLTRDGLLAYFVDAAKPRAEWLVGMEVERMGRAADGGDALPYDATSAPRAGIPTIRGAIEAYRALRGGAPVLEGPHIIGLNGPWGNISLEPGGQFEWSSRPYGTLDELRDALADHEAALERVAADLRVRWLDEAVEPELPLDAMPWMPKARYNIMRPFLGQRGRLAHRMMTQTAAIQVAYDYADGEDWRRKFACAARLAPVAVALFANSSRVDGGDSGYASYRQAIWRETDPARCGLPAVAFDPGFDLEAWVDWVLDVPTIFRHRASGRIATGGVPFRDLLRLGGCDAVRMSDWESHVSTVFTEVRSYNYIEVRSADLQPREHVFAVPTFWTGLLYQDDALTDALELGRPFATHDAWREGMEVAARDGLSGRAAGASLGEAAASALALAARGLRDGAACVRDADAAAAHLERLAEFRNLRIPTVPTGGSR